MPYPRRFGRSPSCGTNDPDSDHFQSDDKRDSQSSDLEEEEGNLCPDCLLPEDLRRLRERGANFLTRCEAHGGEGPARPPRPPPRSPPRRQQASSLSNSPPPTPPSEHFNRELQTACFPCLTDEEADRLVQEARESDRLVFQRLCPAHRSLETARELLKDRLSAIALPDSDDDDGGYDDDDDDDDDDGDYDSDADILD